MFNRTNRYSVFPAAVLAALVVAVVTVVATLVEAVGGMQTYL